jgi:hypothetical protein
MELDNPFRGAVSIGPGSITRVDETVMKTDESAPDKTDLKAEGTAETTQPRAFQGGTPRISPDAPGNCKGTRSSLNGPKVCCLNRCRRDVSDV